MKLGEVQVFEYIPFETLINESQNDYYKALKASDTSGDSTLFVEYMLKVIDKSISTATASRDLKKGLEIGLFEKTGHKNLTIYKKTTGHNR